MTSRQAASCELGGEFRFLDHMMKAGVRLRDDEDRASAVIFWQE
jgi:hypothetical protein